MGGRIAYAGCAGDRTGRARKAQLFLACAAALPDGHDPCGRAGAPSGRGALARGSRGHGQARWPAAALRWPSRPIADGAQRRFARVASCRCGRGPCRTTGTRPLRWRAPRWTHEPHPSMAVASARIFCPTSANRSEEALGDCFGRASAVLGDGGRRLSSASPGAVFHYATSPKVFEASATLLIEEQRAELEQEISAALPTSRNDTSMLNEMQILASLQVASDVVDDAGPDGQSGLPEPALEPSVADGFGGQGVCPRADPGAGNGAGDGGPAGRRRRRSVRKDAGRPRLRANTVFHRVGRSFVVEIWYRLHDPVLAADDRERLCRRLYRRRHPRDGAIGR
jgi:hypothetical protein